MATTTRSRLRALLGIALGNEPRLYYAGTTTSAGTSATLVDTSVPRFDTTRLVNKWVYIKSAGASNDASGQSRRIASVSSSTITVVTAFTVAIDTAVTYDVLPFDPLDMHNALQYAGRVINSDSPLSLAPDETLVVDNLISNWDFETYASSVFTGWTTLTTGNIISQDTTRFVHGAQAARITNSGVTGLEQDILSAALGGLNRIGQAVGKTLHVIGWLHTTIANNARLRVTFDGTTYTNGPYHVGQDEWEGPNLQKIDAAIPANATEMTVSAERSLTTAFSVDAVVAWIDSVSRYTVPTGFIFPSPTKVSQQVDQSRPNGDYAPLTLENPAVAGRILRLEGLGRLTVPTTDTGTVELDETRSELLIALAAAFLLRNDPSTAQESLMWRNEAERLKGAAGVGQNLEFLTTNRHNPWKVVDEAGTSYLRLIDRR